MTRLTTVNGVEVRVYQDHNPPYFHRIDVDSEVQVSLATMMVMEGESRRRSYVGRWSGLPPTAPR